MKFELGKTQGLKKNFYYVIVNENIKYSIRRFKIEFSMEDNFDDIMGEIYYDTLLKTEDIISLLKQWQEHGKYGFKGLMESVNTFDDGSNNESVVSYLVRHHRQEEALKVIEFMKIVRAELKKEQLLD